MISSVKDGEQTLGIIVYASFKPDEDSIRFLTPDDSSFQLGIMSRNTGYSVMAHVHRKVKREIEQTQEVLFIRSGQCRVSFYSDKKKLVEEIDLKSGDIVMFISGGHAIRMMAKTDILEVKQGPYLGELDKERFEI